MKVMQRPTVHIGFTKAASTFLQGFFQDHPGIHFPDRTRIYELFARDNTIFFDRSNVEKYFFEQTQIAGSRALVCSHERLSGCPHSGFYDYSIIANNLCAFEPKVIIVIRDQYDIIASCYKEYILNGGTRTLHEYVLPPHDGRLPLFDWRPLRYLELISLYYAQLGEQAVKVILFEHIVKNWNVVLDDLALFIGVPPLISYSPSEELRNTGAPEAEIDKLRFENMTDGLLTTVSVERGNPKGRIGRQLVRLGVQFRPNEFLGQCSLRDKLRDFILGKEFAESNRRLSDLLKVDLANEGYVT